MTTENTQSQAVSQVEALSAENEIAALRHAFLFFSNFPNVPGHASKNWASALDAIAAAANSLIKKNDLLKASDQQTEQTEQTEQK